MYTVTYAVLFCIRVLQERHCLQAFRFCIRVHRMCISLELICDVLQSFVDGQSLTLFCSHRICYQSVADFNAHYYRFLYEQDLDDEFFSVDLYLYTSRIYFECCRFIVDLHGVSKKRPTFC